MLLGVAQEIWNSTMGGLSASADAGFTDLYSGVSLSAFVLPVLCGAILILLSSARVWASLEKALGVFARWIKLLLEGGATYLGFWVLYQWGLMAEGFITWEMVLRLVKWGALFTAIGWVSDAVYSRIWKNLKTTFKEEEN